MVAMAVSVIAVIEMGPDVVMMVTIRMVPAPSIRTAGSHASRVVTVIAAVAMVPMRRGVCRCSCCGAGKAHDSNKRI